MLLVFASWLNTISDKFASITTLCSGGVCGEPPRCEERVAHHQRLHTQRDQRPQRIRLSSEIPEMEELSRDVILPMFASRLSTSSEGSVRSSSFSATASHNAVLVFDTTALCSGGVCGEPRRFEERVAHHHRLHTQRDQRPQRVRLSSDIPEMEELSRDVML